MGEFDTFPPYEDGEDTGNVLKVDVDMCEDPNCEQEHEEAAPLPSLLKLGTAETSVMSSSVVNKKITQSQKGGSADLASADIVEADDEKVAARKDSKDRVGWRKPSGGSPFLSTTVISNSLSHPIIMLTTCYLLLH